MSRVLDNALSLSSTGDSESDSDVLADDVLGAEPAPVNPEPEGEIRIISTGNCRRRPNQVPKSMPMSQPPRSCPPARQLSQLEVHQNYWAREVIA